MNKLISLFLFLIPFVSFGQTYTGNFGVTPNVGKQFQAFPNGSVGQVPYVQSTGVLGWETISGGGGSSWSLTGNSGTTPYTNFVGTTDNNDFVGKINNKVSFLIDPTNIILGYQAGDSNTSTGVGNVALGHNALSMNTTGSNNMAIGAAALQTNTTGNGNVAIGIQALLENEFGTNNTAVGENALSSMTGVVGGLANVAIGSNALLNTQYSDNVGIGTSAGATNSTGYQNTCIGYQSDVGSNSLNNATSLGFGAIASASNCMTLGNNSVTQFQFNGAFMPYYSSSYNAGSQGQVLISYGSGAAPQWVNPNIVSTYTLTSIGQGIGFSNNPGSYITAIITLSGAGTLTSVTFPSTPINGTIVIITSASILALTSGNFTPTPTVLSTGTESTGTFMEFQYNASTWYEIQ